MLAPRISRFLGLSAVLCTLAGCGRIGLTLEDVEPGVGHDDIAGDGYDDEPLSDGDVVAEPTTDAELLDGGPLDGQSFEEEDADSDPDASAPVEDATLAFEDASALDATTPRDAMVDATTPRDATAPDATARDAAPDAITPADACVPGTCGCGVVPPPGLLAHYTLNESAGSSARDGVAGRIGTLTNMAGNEWSPARLGNGLSLDGVDDYVALGNLGTGVRAVSFWLRADTYGVTTTQTGWQSPSSTGSPNNEWSNPARAYAADGSSASAFIALIIITRTQDWGGFRLNVPSAVQGIEVKLNSGGVSLLSGTGVELSWNAGGNYTGAGYGGSGLIELGNNVTTFGANNRNWGRAWQSSELNDNNFRVRVRAGGLLGTATLDHLQVNVHYASYTQPRAIMRFSGTSRLEFAGQNIAAVGLPAGTQIYVDGALGSNVPAGFHHVVVVAPTAIDASAMQLGAASGGSLSFDGQLDDVKLFTQPQSAANVSTLYNDPTCGL